MSDRTPLEQFLYDTGIAMPGDTRRVALQIEASTWLAKVKADAWDEGHLIHGEDYRHPRQCRDSSGCIAQSPYRIEGKTDDH